jgi:dephospho-CoA kinase
MPADDARARIKAQATDPQRRAVADVVIMNDGTLDDLREQVDALWGRLVEPGGGLEPFDAIQ